MSECRKCGFNNEDFGCSCPSGDKWYTCPIESKKPENVQALFEETVWMEFKRYASEHNIIPVSCEFYEEMMRNREELSKYRKILLEIQKEIKDCNLILYKDGVFFIPQYEVLNIIDKYITGAEHANCN